MHASIDYETELNRTCYIEFSLLIKALSSKSAVDLAKSARNKMVIIWWVDFIHYVSVFCDCDWQL